MVINSSVIGMESARSYRAASYSIKRFEIKDYSGAPAENSSADINSDTKANSKADTKANTKTDAAADTKADTKTGTTQDTQGVSPFRLIPGGNRFISRSFMNGHRETIEKIRNNYQSRLAEETTAETIRQKSIFYIFEMLFDRFKSRFEDLFRDEDTLSSGNISGENGAVGGSGYSGNEQGYHTAGAPIQLSINNIYSADYYSEEEQTSFSAQGKVITADGRELDFNIDVAMTRAFEEYYESRMQVTPADAVKMCDPLVINLNGNIASVSDQKIRFDIDGDGEPDTINRLASGSGYLALDKNGDGKINDGTELFGTASGDGFADLAQYDEDGNGWIDENDSVWNKLRIFSYGEDGSEHLYSLAESGVGALCLSKLGTEFSQKDENNETNAAIRSTGIFLYENGMAGTMQHVDLVKYV